MLQARPGRKSKQQQEQNSPNLRTAFLPSPVEGEKWVERARNAKNFPSLTLKCGLSESMDRIESPLPLLALPGEVDIPTCLMKQNFFMTPNHGNEDSVSN